MVRTRLAPAADAVRTALATVAAVAAAVVAVAALPPLLVRRDLGDAQLDPAGLAAAVNQARVTVLLALAALAAVTMAGLWTRAALRRRRESWRGELTGRFAEAIRNLASDRLDQQLEAVYALEGMLRSSASDTRLIAELLTTYVRASAGPATQRDGDAAPLQIRAPAVQAVMSVLARIPVPERDALPLQLNGTDLRRASLLGARLRGAVLTDADLSGTVLTSAQLQDAFLNRARLEGAVLGAAHLERAVLLGANLRKAVLVGAHMEGTVATRADLRGAHLLGARLDRANLDRARLEDAILLGAHMEQAILTGGRLGRAVLTGACLREADLTGSNLRGADLRRADLRRAQLRGADLRGADLGAANLTSAGLAQADLREARADDDTRWPLNFDPLAAGVVHDSGVPGPVRPRLLEPPRRGAAGSDA
jgi:uncharacterized protein YjbI with pentapeptide repeats